MPEIKKRRPSARENRPVVANAVKAAQTSRQQPPPLKRAEDEVAKRIFDASAREPSRDELGPLSCLLFDANQLLNGYLEALRSVENDKPRQPGAASIADNGMKRAGAA